MEKEQDKPISQQANAGCLSLIVRLTWMVVGNGLLFFTAIFIAQQRAGVILDILFWGAVAGLVLTRYIDITIFHGQTAENEPATLHHWRRYALLLIVVAAGIWVVAHGAARLL